jgi:ElaB/YqjD/DUF883 family membrane-anchored ribosome-binding protein
VGEDPERIEQEIERTRAKLGEDLDALEEKVNPKKVANRSVDRAKEKAAEVKERLAGAAGAAKEKVAGAAKEKVGGSGGGQGADYGTGVSSVNGSGSSAAGSGSGLASTAKGKVAPLAATAREKVGPLAATARSRASSLAATAKDRAATSRGMDPQTADTRQVATAVAGDAWSTVREQTRKNPVPVGAVAFTVGLLLGRR